MEIGKRYSIDVPQISGKEALNLNEFTPVKGKTTRYEVLKEFLKQKDVAPWFRGTSHFHLQGADKLFNALRDDREQRTTHRVRNCLNLIGLKPMITSKQIKFLMHLSQGNDLVFLWFLMEMHYKTPKHDPNSYSVNEQLICSAICHLDMITTLRELDKILPCGDTSKIETKKANPKRQEIKKNERTSHEFMLPYFKKYCRPEYYGKRLFLNEPNFKVNFNDRYNNPNQNESNRWYADYQFNPGKRIVHSIIRETIKNIFYNFETVSLRSNTIQILCDYHKTLKMISDNRKHELNVEARNKCLKHYFNSQDMKNDNVNKINILLDNAVQQQLCKFNEQTKIKDPKNHSLKIISSDCKTFDVILGSNALDNTNTNTINDSVKINAAALSNIFHKEQKHCDLHEHVLDKKNKHHNSQLQTDKFDGRKKFTHPNYDYYNVSNTVHPSDALFIRSTNHKPFKFDYGKIFAPKCKDNEKRCIRKMFLAALNEDIASSFSTEFDQSSIIYDEAIKKYTKSTFENKVKKYEAEKMNEIKAQKAECLRPISQYPSLTKYKGENSQLIEEMLYAAFQYLRKNPKFVWAQLPDAHRVPLLREWIARRFGKEYTPKEKSKSYRRSCIIFRALDRSNIKLPVPNANRIGKKLFLDYSCRKHVDKKVHYIRNEYYHRLDSSFFERTRIFWFAMRGYICSSGPPRKSFFAYMPSRLQDIHHFRPWKSSEYRINKVARNVLQDKNMS